LQIIKNESDINVLNINGNYSVSIQSTDFLSLSDIINVSQGADKIVFNNAHILVDCFDLISNEIQLSGETIITTNTTDDLLSNLKLSNVGGNGFITVKLNNMNSLYNIKAVRDNENVYFVMSRETDYIKILGYKDGHVVNSMRASSVNSKLVSAMDRAGSISEIYDFIDKSVLFKPINLMRPIKIFNNFESGGFNSKNKYTGASFSPIYILNKNLNLYAGKLGMSFNYYDWNINFYGYAGSFTESDDINNFSGNIYGGNINAYFDNKDVWLDMFLGYTGAQFNTNGVLNGDDLIYTPAGYSLYNNIDVGLKFYNSGFYFSPFVGAGATSESVLNDKDSSVFGKAGSKIGFGFSESGLRYNYSAFINLQTDKIQIGGLKMSVWSIADGAGGDVSYEMLHDEIGLSHKISGNLKFSF
jgi:hypothetical protein